MQHPTEPTRGTRPERSRSALRALFVFAAGWVCFSSASPARATPDYPFVLDAALETSCPRPLSRCLICHTTARGGQRTAVQPFAESLRDYGLTRGGDGAALQGALLALPDETDSDDDGVTDKDELVACGNPSGEDLGIGPEYGCDGAHLARVARSEAPLVLVALGVAGLLMRRRRA